MSFGQPKIRGEAYVKLPDPDSASVVDHYRRDAFEDGLSAVGYSIRRTPASPPKDSDVLVLWNRYIRDEQLARDYERAGGTVLITENAWIGPEEKDKHYFALCRGHHNGLGTWHVGQRTRTNVLDIEYRPWRTSGEHLVLLPQRGMGEPGIRMPAGWLDDVKARLAQVTKRKLVVQAHPGPRPHPPIDWSGAWAAVTWASGAGIKAIIAGIPVFYELKGWIGGDAARYGIDKIEAPYLESRGTMLRKLSWAMWTAAEIRAGEPFKCLLS